MNMKVRLTNIKFYKSSGDKNYEIVGTINILGGNIYPNENSKLPNNSDSSVNFAFDYSDAYDFDSNGIVNVRFRYPYSGSYKGTEKEGRYIIFAKLKWWQRLKLSYINGQSWLHTNPVATIALFVNVIAGLINIIVGFINFSHGKTELQTGLLKQQIEILQEQNENQANFFKLISDSSKKEKPIITDSLNKK